MNRAAGVVPLAWVLASVSGCQWILGFEDHGLEPVDGGAGGASLADRIVIDSGRSQDDGGGERSAGGAGGGRDAGATGGASGDGGRAGAGGATPGTGGTEAGGTEAGPGLDAGAAGGDAGCLLCGVRSALVHRYRFDGSGTSVVDSIGSADGTTVGVQLSGTGMVTLAGGTSNQHVALPSGLLSGLADATFEVWFSWEGGNAWQRVFDLGSRSGSVGQTYVFLTPATGANSGMRVALTSAGAAAESSVSGMRPTTGALTHAAVVVDATGRRLSLYIDGELEGAVGTMTQLSQVNDVNNWLGRSQYNADADFGGSIHEFRIYDSALGQAELRATFAEGPDPAFLEE